MHHPTASNTTLWQLLQGHYSRQLYQTWHAAAGCNESLGLGIESLTSKPQSNLLLCIFYTVATMDDIAPDLNAVVTTDGAWCAGLRVCCTNHCATGSNNVLALPDLQQQWHTEDARSGVASTYQLATATSMQTRREPLTWHISLCCARSIMEDVHSMLAAKDSRLA